MKEFKYEYKTPISYIKESPNKYVDLLVKFKEMKILAANLKIYSRIKEITTTSKFQYNHGWILDTIGSIPNRSYNRYYKTLRYNAMYYTDIPFQSLRNKYLKYLNYRRPISQYKRRIE